MDLIFGKMFFLSTAALTYSISSNSHFSMPGTYTPGDRRTPNQTDSDVTFSKSCDQGEITNSY